MPNDFASHLKLCPLGGSRSFTRAPTISLKLGTSVVLHALITHAKPFRVTSETLPARGRQSSRSFTRTPTISLKFGTWVGLYALIMHAKPFRVTLKTLPARGRQSFRNSDSDSTGPLRFR